MLREAERLVKAGVKELLVISQDTCAYGVDLQYAASAWRDREVRAKFIDLARELGELGAWVRLHYVYPYPHVDEVIPLMAEGKLLPYLDIPFQHASPRVLKAMSRPGNQEKTLERIARWRDDPPGSDASARPSSSAFPARPKRISRCFSTGSRKRSSTASAASATSRSRGAPANDLGRPGARGGEGGALARASWSTADDQRQAAQAQGRPAAQVIVDEPDRPSPRGAPNGDAPEIDGVVHVTSRRPLRAGEIVTVKIERADAYDLHGVAA